MSGGYFKKTGFEIELFIDNVARDSEFRKNCPQLSKVLQLLSMELGELINKYDLHASGDSYIDDIKSFEINAINALRNATFDHLKKGGSNA